MRLGLSAILGIRSQLRRLRILIGEGALAAEDRAELLRFAWEDEKRRLRWMLGLVSATARASTAFEPVRREFDRDREWLRHSLGRKGRAMVPREPRPVTREELLARIEKQRVRIATLEAAARGVGEVPGAPESTSAMAMRIVREHPVATGVAAASVVAVLGPRRLVRWASVIVPVLWRMR